MNKKIPALIMASIISITCLSGCSKLENDQKSVNISMLNSKYEIDSLFKSTASEFSDINHDINVKIIRYTGEYYNKLKSMAAADNMPTLVILDPKHLKSLAETSADLSNEEWVNDISVELSSYAKNSQGQLVAFPFACEGLGLVYNKEVLDKAGIDPSSIHTQKDLEEAFKKLEAIGKKGVVFPPEAWSLADHFITTAYAADQSESDIQDKYFEKLKKEDIKNNKKINGLLDTLDLIKNYNFFKSNPLSPTYDKCSEILGKGEVGFAYLGNWAANKIISSADGKEDFGYIPVPISNDASDPANNSLVMGVTKYIMVDKSTNSEEQQKAARKFLNYLVYDEKGQNFLVEKANIIPAFKNITLSPDDPLSKSLIEYRNQGNILEFMNSYIESDNAEKVGEPLREYLAGKIDRQQLLQKIDDFWS